MNIIRYFPIAGAVFFFIWIWKKDWFQPFRIQTVFPKAERLWFEIKQSFTTLITFTLVAVGNIVLIKLGYLPSNVYFDLDKFPLWYIPVSFLLLTVWHETWFYWMHRAVHTKFLYKWVHSVHHRSVNPSPLAAYNFHFTEAFLEAIYLPIFITFVPLAFPVLLFHTFYAMILNIYLHTGYEFYPKNWVTNPVTKWINPSTHHNMHHAKFHGNYSLYFNFWDRVMGTNFDNYEEFYGEITERRNLALNERKGKTRKENTGDRSNPKENFA
jgi:sterol desaturase/sphingolipid hydroxylase (fatty acid hydroxylase superfamily)